jgi:hypothetical protein
MTTSPPFELTRLEWEDEALGEIALPKAALKISRSFGSGLFRRPSDPLGLIWATGDRGPNLKVQTMIERYGADHLGAHGALAGAKVMARPDVGPRIARLKLNGDRVELIDSFDVTDARGRPVSGLPMPESAHAKAEPALSLAGERLAPDPSGLDPEGNRRLGRRQPDPQRGIRALAGADRRRRPRARPLPAKGRRTGGRGLSGLCDPSRNCRPAAAQPRLRGDRRLARSKVAVRRLPEPPRPPRRGSASPCPPCTAVAPRPGQHESRGAVSLPARSARDVPERRGGGEKSGHATSRSARSFAWPAAPSWCWNGHRGPPRSTG